MWLARVMLLSILDTFRVKFEELNRSFPKQKDDDAMDEDTEMTQREVSEARPIRTLSQAAENPVDPTKGTHLFLDAVLIQRWPISLPQSGERVQDYPLRSTKL